MHTKETHTGEFITMDEHSIMNADRGQLQEYLEARGYAVYDHESTELLRECALDDLLNC